MIVKAILPVMIPTIAKTANIPKDKNINEMTITPGINLIKNM